MPYRNYQDTLAAVRRWRQQNPEKVRAYEETEERRKKHRQHVCAHKKTPRGVLQSRAYHAINEAVASGRIARPKNCSKCGNAGLIEAHHHRGYERQVRLDVVWVCKPCHVIAEKSAAS